MSGWGKPVGVAAATLVVVAAAVTVAATIAKARPAGDGALAGALMLPPGAEPATVELLSKDGAQVARVQTDETGRFRFTSLAPGTYGVRLHLRQPVNLPAGWGYVCPHERRLSGIPVTDGTTTDLGGVPVERHGYGIRMRLKGADPAMAVHGLTVHIWQPGTGRVRHRQRWVETDGAGVASVALDDARASEPVALVPLLPRDEGRVGTSPVWVTPKIWETVEIQVEVGRRPIDRNVVRLVDERGSPIGGAEVLLLDKAAPRFARFSLWAAGRSSPGGEITLFSLPAEGTQLAVRRPGHAWRVLDLPARPEAQGPTVVVVPSGVRIACRLATTLAGQPLTTLLAAIRRRVEAANGGDMTGVELPSLGLLLVNAQTGSLLGPMVPDAVWASGKASETVEILGVAPGRYRALLVPVSTAQNYLGSDSIDCATVMGLAEMSEKWLIDADGLPPLATNEFTVPGDGAATIVLTGDTSAARAAELAGRLPPYYGGSESMVRAVMAAIANR